MNTRFTALRIVTNGQQFRIQALMSEVWTFLSNYYMGCDTLGYVPAGEIKEFPSRAAAVDYIKEQFGNVGLNKLNNTWIPC
jgi:hypothetical protein